MNRLAAAIAFGVVVILLGAAAQAQTADDLKAELAAKKAYISKLERRIRQLESQPARSSQPPPTPMVIAPVGGRPPAVPSACWRRCSPSASGGLICRRGGSVA